MNPLGIRSRADELARLLDSGAGAPPAVAGLHALGVVLERSAVPRQEFRDALRTRLVAVASVAAAADPAPTAASTTWTSSRRTQRRFGVAAGAMASVVAITGIGIASSRSLPGQPFYSLKLTTEDLQLGLAGGDVAKGGKHLEFAQTRLREVQAMAAGRHEVALGTEGALGALVPQAAGLGGSSAQVRDVLAAMDRETRSGQALLQRAFRTSGDPAPLTMLVRFSTSQRSGLARVLTTLPTGARDRAEASLVLADDVGRDAGALLALGTCTAGCNPATAGPVLPQPLPGSSAAPAPAAPAGAPPCGCAPGPVSTAVATSDPTSSGGTPTPRASASSGARPTASPSASATPRPTAVPGPVPTGVLPTGLVPTSVPVPVPLPGLPTEIPLPPLP